MHWLSSSRGASLSLLQLAIVVYFYGRGVIQSDGILAFSFIILAIFILLTAVFQPKIRNNLALLLFHLSLIMIMSLAAYGRMVYMQGHFELVEGQKFEAGLLEGVKHGPWFNMDMLKHIQLLQGPFSVEYGPELSRGKTSNEIYVGSPEEKILIGDDTPYLSKGVRIYSSRYKGFSPVITFSNGQSEIMTAINMPNYPLLMYQQENYWVVPGTDEKILFYLDLTTGLDEEKAWRLESKMAYASLMVGEDKQSIEVSESIDVPPYGKIRYDSLLMWKGYNVYYDPTLRWIFLVAMVSVFSLVIYVVRKYLPGLSKR